MITANERHTERRALRRRFKRGIDVVLILLLLVGCGRLPPPRSAPVSTTVPTPVAAAKPARADAEAQAQHRRIFKRVWEIAADHYVDPSFNGLDWEAQREAFEPRIDAAPDDPAFWTVMQEMIAQLDDAHSVYLTPAQAEEEDRAMRGDLTYVGIGVYVNVPTKGGYGVVLAPMPESPAEAAGIRAHDRILAVDGNKVGSTPEGLDALDRLLGKPGTTVNVAVQSPDSPPRELEIRRAQLDSRIPIGSRRLTADSGEAVAYLMIPTLWEETAAERTRKALKALLDAGPVAGLVVDMRINGGGAYKELYDLLSLFVSGEAGTFIRQGETVETVTVTPDPIGPSQTLPLVVLIGEHTESYAEVFSGVLQDVGRATLIGAPTAGNVETVYPYNLEDGSRLWLAEETFEPPSGARWEGTGVQPDRRVPGRWEDFSAADDPQLTAALEWLTNP